MMIFAFLRCNFELHTGSESNLCDEVELWNFYHEYLGN